MPNDKAKTYAAVKYGLSIAGTVYLIIILCCFQGFGIAKILAGYLAGVGLVPVLVFPAYLAVISGAYAILDFPLNFYRSFVLEHNYHLSTQNFINWLKDQLKSGAITYCIGIILFGAFYYILDRFPQTWWLVVSAVWIALSVVMARLFPVIIIPLFFKSKPLTDDTLRGRIMALAEKMRVRLLNVFEIDFSKKTLKANAAFVGFGASRRVLLAGTLKDKYSVDEIEVILAHEFAHYRLKHLVKLICVNAATTIAVFYIISMSQGYALRLFGLASLADLAAFGLVLLYFICFGIIATPFENYISRRLEADADRMALAVTGNKGAFISMMEKLGNQNLADRNPSTIVKIFFFDHPPIDERIALANQI
jgi:STE24 endopeptidase